jgi:hypothetical protein
MLVQPRKKKTKPKSLTKQFTIKEVKKKKKNGKPTTYDHFYTKKTKQTNT